MPALLGCRTGETANSGSHLHPDEGHKSVRGDHDRGIQQRAERSDAPLNPELERGAKERKSNKQRGELSKAPTTSSCSTEIRSSLEHFFGLKYLMVRFMCRRPPKHGECTYTSVSAHLSSTTAKRRDIGKQALGPAQKSHREKRRGHHCKRFQHFGLRGMRKDENELDRRSM